MELNGLEEWEKKALGAATAFREAEVQRRAQAAAHIAEPPTLVRAHEPTSWTGSTVSEDLTGPDDYDHEDTEFVQFLAGINLSAFAADFCNGGLTSVDQLADHPEFLSNAHLGFLTPLQRRKLRAAVFDVSADGALYGGGGASSQASTEGGGEAARLEQHFEGRGVSLDGGGAGCRKSRRNGRGEDVRSSGYGHSSSFSSVPSPAAAAMVVGGRAVARRGARGSVYFQAPADPEEAVRAVGARHH